jgi:hypothetical protein
MSEEVWFSQNNRDLSVSYGNDAGFEFEFYCRRCGDTWRSGFENYTLGRASGWLRRASSMASNVTSNIGFDVANTVGDLADAGWHKARDAALKRAVGQAEVEQARAQGQVQAAREAGFTAGAESVQSVDVVTQHQLVCPQCRTETHGAKFCPECGHRIDQPAHCGSCGQPVPPAAKFCPECGTPA